MSAKELLCELRASGIDLQVSGDQIHLRGPKPPTVLQKAKLVRLKPQLLELLRNAAYHNDDLGWQRLRDLGNHLGKSVKHRDQIYQLWGITPRGAICFNGRVLITIDQNEVHHM